MEIKIHARTAEASRMRKLEKAEEEEIILSAYKRFHSSNVPKLCEEVYKRLREKGEWNVDYKSKIERKDGSTPVTIAGYDILKVEHKDSNAPLVIRSGEILKALYVDYVAGWEINYGFAIKQSLDRFFISFKGYEVKNSLPITSDSFSYFKECWKEIKVETVSKAEVEKWFKYLTAHFRRSKPYAWMHAGKPPHYYRRVGHEAGYWIRNSFPARLWGRLLEAVAKDYLKKSSGRTAKLSIL